MKVRIYTGGDYYDYIIIQQLLPLELLHATLYISFQVAVANCFMLGVD